MWAVILKIAKRRFLKHKASTFTKLFSLSTGIISLFYIGLYLQHELSFDDFHQNRTNIFKVNTDIRSPTGDLQLGLSAIPIGPYLKSVAPEISDFVRINKEYGSHAIKQGDALYSESEKIYYADPSFFRIFDFKMLSGEASTALEGPDKLVVTRHTALKYFGHTDVVGKVLHYDGTPMNITGVVENLPSNTHLQFDFLFSMDTFMKDRPEGVDDNWTWVPMNTYLLLVSRADEATIARRLSTLPKYMEDNDTGDRYIANLEPLDGLHFSTPKLGELGPKGKRSNLYLLIGIGIMILLLAVSNYINLTTASLSVEGKNVSMKRTLGASKNDIFKEFIAESLLVSFLALILSVAGIALTYRAFELFMGATHDLSVFANPMMWLLILSAPLILTAIGGIYPALKFARIPALYKDGAINFRQGILTTRTGLVILQFSITSALIIGSLLIYSQLKFLQYKDLGLDTEHKLVLEYGPNAGIGNSYESLKSHFTGIPGVEAATFSSHVPGQTPNGVSTLLHDPNGESRNGEINLNLVDHDFVSSYGLEIIAGRDFRPGVADSTSALILNEAAVRAFGYSDPEQIIGVAFEQWGGNGVVIGVVKDFNYLSLHQDIGLLSLKIWPGQFEKITLTISETAIDQTLAALETKWSTLFPDIPFNYYFVEDNFLLQYEQDRQFATIMNLFTLVSVCVGLLGLVAYATFWCNRRKKEISIKKVLGAKSLNLLWNLYRGFSVPVLAGFAIALPVSLYLGQLWLSQFAYQFDLKWYFFILPLLILLVLVAMSVGVQTVRLVRCNPAENLKVE